MNKTSVVFTPKYYLHNTGRNHPESAKRLKAILAELEAAQFFKRLNLNLVSPVKASLEQISMVHDSRYIKYVKTLSRSGGGLLDDGDTRVSVRSFDVALEAVGGAVTAVDQVMQGNSDNAFALVRPPGHHAARFYGLGFCIFNNIAIAAEHLLREFGFKRVLILDIDSHHGNGTQDIFYKTDRVLYVSLHEDPTDFPGTGFADEVGDCDGAGFTVNVPLPLKTGDKVYLKGFREIIVPIVRQYRPQFMLVSAGFDSHYADPVGGLRLSARCHEEIFGALTGLASDLCDGRLVLVLEGGYNLDFIGKLAAQALATISGTHYEVEDTVPKGTSRTEEEGEKAIKKAKMIQRDSWHLD